MTDLYVATHRDLLDQPFYSVERFLDRLVDGYSLREGFELVVASVGGEPVGQAFGYPLPATSRWWRG